MSPTRGPASAPAERLPRLAWVATFGAATLLAVHLLMTALHVAPVNPVTVQHETLVRRWTEPLFTQNWKLFAPDPIAVDQGLLVKTRTDDRRESEYVDVVSGYLEAKHHSVLAPRDGYLVSGVLTRFLEARQEAVSTLPEDARGGGLFLDRARLAALEPDVRAAYEQVLEDVRDAAAWHVAADDPSVRAVKLRIVQHTFPRFSERHDDGVGEIRHDTSDWLTLERSAA